MEQDYNSKDKTSMVQTLKKVLEELPKDEAIKEVAQEFECAKLELQYSKLIDPLGNSGVITKCAVKKELKGPDVAFKKMNAMLNLKLVSSDQKKEQIYKEKQAAGKGFFDFRGEMLNGKRITKL